MAFGLDGGDGGGGGSGGGRDDGFLREVRACIKGDVRCRREEQETREGVVNAWSGTSEKDCPQTILFNEIYVRPHPALLCFV